jgi:alpha-methylacyl-CoA racemase
LIQLSTTGKLGGCYFSLVLFSKSALRLILKIKAALFENNRLISPSYILGIKKNKLIFTLQKKSSTNTMQNIKILDFSRLLPAPLATEMLAELGATVWKVERPHSPDSLRQQPPFVSDTATLFHLLNSRKTSLFIDYTTEAGRNELIPYITQADIIVEQFRPNVMQAWGLDYESICKINPNIIYISVTGYGQKGQWASEAGHDINFLALSGLLDLLRDEQQRPVMPNFQIADVAGGSYPIVVAAQSAIIERYSSKKGKFIDLAMSAGAIPLMSIALSQLFGGISPKEINFLSGGLVNYNIYICADDKWLAFAGLELKFWANFCHAVGRPDWLRKHITELSITAFDKSQLDALFRTRSQSEWTEWALGKDVCITPIVEMQDWLTSPIVEALQLIRRDAEGRISLRFLPFHTT